MKDLIDSGHNGILVAPDSPGDLAAAVLRLARDPVYRSSVMDAAAHSARERVSLQAMFSSHERIYREVFLTSGPPRLRA
jgi:glycosyltransferase involved in cell wall biosynthesis